MTPVESTSGVKFKRTPNGRNWIVTTGAASAPVPVLREVTAIATRYDIPVQASVDVPMACGTGVCMGCVLPVTGTDGITRIVRSCVDGPVFRADLIRWDDIGTIPFDALGAPGWKPMESRYAG